jgi:sugar phosphate isomerase/epimerase
VNHISVTTAPLNILIGEDYHNLRATLNLAKEIWNASAVDGFEFQYLAEWDASTSPRDDKTKSHRRTAWETSEKHTERQIADIILESDVPIISVHGNRDIGICLCSEEKSDQEIGNDMLHDTFLLADSIGANLVVFHLWDTWKDSFNLKYLQEALTKASQRFPNVTPTVENVPTHLKGHTPFDLVSVFEFVTLDLRWAVMYDEFENFSEIADKIANVHIRASLIDGIWAMMDSPFTIEDALNKICIDWGYTGPLTVEPEGGLRQASLSDFNEAFMALRS